jgi:tetratricopeptide (TPR) repeat protein
MGCAVFSVGAREQALECFMRARGGAARSGDRRVEAMAVNAIASVLDSLERYGEALHHARQAGALALEAGEQKQVAMAMHNQAHAYQALGDPRTATGLFEAVERIGVRLQDDALVMAASIGLASLCRDTDPRRALELFEKAIGIAEEIGDADALNVCYRQLAGWDAPACPEEQKRRLRERALRLSRKIYGEAMGRALIGIGKAHTFLGNYEEAREYLDRGLEFISASSERTAEPPEISTDISIDSKWSGIFVA